MKGDKQQGYTRYLQEIPENSETENNKAREPGPDFIFVRYGNKGVDHD